MLSDIYLDKMSIILEAFDWIVGFAWKIPNQGGEHLFAIVLLFLPIVNQFVEDKLKYVEQQRGYGVQKRTRDWKYPNT